MSVGFHIMYVDLLQSCAGPDFFFQGVLGVRRLIEFAGGGDLRRISDNFIM